MKLPKGPLKLIISDPEKAIENQDRAQVGGKIFVPVYTVYVWDDLAPPGSPSLTIHKAHSFAGRDLRPRTTRQSQFPHKWAPSALRDCVMWLETEGELTLQLSQEDTHG